MGVLQRLDGRNQRIVDRQFAQPRDERLFRGQGRWIRPGIGIGAVAVALAKVFASGAALIVVLALVAAAFFVIAYVLERRHRASLRVQSAGEPTSGPRQPQ
jgi:hypothetical protein